MSPNPYILLRNLVSPTRWFTQGAPQTPKSKGRLEHWQEPIPGVYEYTPGRGWFLIAVDTDDGDKLDKPVPLTYCRILHRYMLKEEFESRKRWGVVQDENGQSKKGVLFRLDDGVTWIYCWDDDGQFDTSERRIPYCVDTETRKFRIVTAADRQNIPSCESSDKTLRQGSTSQSGTVTTPSFSSFVEGNVHKPSITRSSVPSTQPSTRPSTRPSSSHGSGLQPATALSNATTPPSFAEQRTPSLDAPELKRKLKRLAEP